MLGIFYPAGSKDRPVLAQLVAQVGSLRRSMGGAEATGILQHAVFVFILPEIARFEAFQRIIGFACSQAVAFFSLLQQVFGAVVEVFGGFFTAFTLQFSDIDKFKFGAVAVFGREGQQRGDLVLPRVDLAVQGVDAFPVFGAPVGNQVVGGVEVSGLRFFKCLFEAFYQLRFLFRLAPEFIDAKGNRVVIIAAFDIALGGTAGGKEQAGESSCNEQSGEMGTGEQGFRFFTIVSQI